MKGLISICFFAILLGAMSFTFVSAKHKTHATKGITGGWTKGTITLKELHTVLTQANADAKIVKIDEVWRQVVAGLHYRVYYTTEDSKKCSATWFYVPWMHPKIRNINVSCD